jgi:hypothetical protein
MVTAKCLNCLYHFDAQRITAKFCSDLCRVQYNRKNSEVKEEPPNIVPTDKTFPKSDSEIKEQSTQKHEQSQRKIINPESPRTKQKLEIPFERTLEGRIKAIEESEKKKS